MSVIEDRRKYQRDYYHLKMLDPDHRKKNAARHRRWYASLTPEQKTARYLKYKPLVDAWHKENPDYDKERHRKNAVNGHKPKPRPKAQQIRNAQQQQAHNDRQRIEKWKTQPCVDNPYGATNKWDWYQGLLKDQQAREARRMGLARSTIE